MSLKPMPPRPMPAELALWGAKHLPPESPYRLVGDKLYEQYQECDYLDLYHPEGKPGHSPVDLALVSAFQYMEKLSDRQAAEAVRMRLDWKYALHLPVDDRGFNFSVLSEFRDRVIRHQVEARLFDHVLQQLAELGLVKQQRGRQRSDSLAVLSKVRALSRLEQVVETLRLAVRALLKADPEWTRKTVPPTWEERYGERCVADKLNKAQHQALSAQVGPDGEWLLERLRAETTPEELRTLSAVEVLAVVWQQQFEEVDGKLVYRPRGTYDGKTYIESPHDPEARYSAKGQQAWVGDKLQVTESDDDNLPHLITDIAVTSSVETDYEALDAIQERLQARNLLPGEQIVDGGYVTEDNLVSSASRSIDLVGPVQKDTTKQARMPDGITLDQFQVDMEACTAFCPGGQQARIGTRRGKRIRFRFPKTVCAACPLRPRCCTGEGGRSLSLGRHYTVLQAARTRQETAAFKQLYRQHRGGVEGCLSSLVRGHGIRVGRYIGRAKRHLQALFTGVAANLRRAARWLAGVRPQAKRRGLRLAPIA